MTVATNTGGARAVADLTGGVILAAVDIAAPAERVWTAITTAEITQWWGSPELYRTEEWTGDLRPGGKWRASGHGADGAAFSVDGEYIKVEPHHTLVQTWNAGWDAGNTTTLTYQIAATPTGSRLTVRHEGFAGRPDACSGHSRGWERVLSWLQSHFAVAGAAPLTCTLCKLVAPRSTFPGDMTPVEGAAMAAHAQYWAGLVAQGPALLFGPVMDPKGAWGLAVVGTQDEAAVAHACANDPVILGKLGFRYETYPMPATTLKGA